MTFNLIGLGLEKESISVEAQKQLESCDKIYLEGYTVDFPYSPEELEQSLNIKIEVLPREKVEDESIIEEAKEKNIALLVYGDSLSATTHTQLILACKKQNIPSQIFHNASIMTSIAQTGLQLYKFGKTSSMPTWTDSWKPDSFMDYIIENQSIKAHSLLLIDIGLDLEKAKEQLKTASGNKEFKLEKIILTSNIGTKNQKIIYDRLDNIPNEIAKPFCFIISSELHDLEKEFLESLKK
ncbi:diphthine synthase [Candidatus Pacearchaeota archaeon]|nr:diphthine synthase [Candidatus Pacearchaeota archaeon]|tara:strand:- start:1046 stop:1762 length:717 start_codon:yes stop_codon:yes gene_type:complete